MISKGPGGTLLPALNVTEAAISNEGVKFFSKRKEFISQPKVGASKRGAKDAKEIFNRLLKKALNG